MKPNKCPAKEKKMRQEKRKKRGGQKAFCAYPNFAILYFSSGSEGCEVCDLNMALWQVCQVSALYSTRVTRKPLA